jgi:hypothetical protein
MKDRLLLIFAGGTCSLLAWAFLHYLGDDAFSALLTIMLIGVSVDNLRLRRRLRNIHAVQGSSLSI